MSTLLLLFYLLFYCFIVLFIVLLFYCFFGQIRILGGRAQSRTTRIPQWTTTPRPIETVGTGIWIHTETLELGVSPTPARLPTRLAWPVPVTVDL
jgi:hypothetical protein